MRSEMFTRPPVSWTMRAMTRELGISPLRYRYMDIGLTPNMSAASDLLIFLFSRNSDNFMVNRINIAVIAMQALYLTEMKYKIC